MGSSQSKTPAPGGKRREGSATDIPINTTYGTEESSGDNHNSSNNSSNRQFFPTPTGHEYDSIDKIAAELPNVIDDESRQQVADYKQACDNGKGPMVACFATAEYLSLFERKHKDAAALYENICFRPSTDKSPNGVSIPYDRNNKTHNDTNSKYNTQAYPAGCFNLAKMLMTGKGGIGHDRPRAYQLFDRACKGGHGGACFLQAQILCTRPGALAGTADAPNDKNNNTIPHDPQKAMKLYESNCYGTDLIHDNNNASNQNTITGGIGGGDSISCYTLAAMLLRGDKVRKTADNVSPQEARGQVPLAVRENEEPRARTTNATAMTDDIPYVIPRDPPRAEKLLQQACDAGGHVTSCHNLAVMYTHGDEGVPADAEKAELYKKKTQEKIHIFGGL